MGTPRRPSIAGRQSTGSVRLKLPKTLIRSRLLQYAVFTFAAVGIVGAITLSYVWVSFSRMIDDRLHGERERTLPRVYARPVEFRRNQSLSQQDLVVRLNDLGYAERAKAQQGGEFSVAANTVTLVPRAGEQAGKAIRLTFPKLSPKSKVAPRGIQAIDAGKTRVDVLKLDPPLLTALMTSGAREKRRHVPLATIPKRMQEAVLSIEDQSFYSHVGINPFRLIGVAISNLFGRGRPTGGSTITQQLARMFFLADEFNEELQTNTWSYGRKVKEAMMSLVLERRASKEEILELYLNDVYLGQRGSFAIHGVAEASRIFFGKDVANVSLSEAAVIAGVIQSPASRSPFVNPKRAVERRNVVLRAMEGEKYITESETERAIREPLQVLQRGVDNEAPYFVDMVGQQIAARFPGVTSQPGAVDVYTTLDLNLQRAALDAMRTGLDKVDVMLSKRRRKTQEKAQGALLAIDPRTGEVLAMIGGRSYNQSQYNRVMDARRQPGSVFKPFVFLAAFEYAAEEGLTDLTPASITLDEPEIFTFDDMTWEPKNYDDYDGEITLRRALAMSRNLGTIHVGARVGFDKVAAFWKKVGVGTPPRGYPAITLGVFELTPAEVAQAYTIFMNDGSVRPLEAIDHVEEGGRSLKPAPPKLKRVARPDTTFLVTNMMRSVLNEGTGAPARAAGFAADAAGKSGTTNDLRDAWFVGFTPELLTVVWVGFDDNQPVGLSGAQAALPIWTDFMKAATAGRGSREFDVPEGITFVEIDHDNGKLASPTCPRKFTESFLVGTEPVEICDLHH
ncbi:MAG TPA: PBP1A family penicillin-binding protein [Vicinamibacterales bacterium]|nr:PBP1A family penicillin-binding protein [Vicinamibacterales bacterium]